MPTRFCLFFFFLSSFAFSQNKATFSFSNIEVTEAISAIESNYDVKISYVNKLVEGKIISFESKERSLQESLTELSEKSQISFKIIDNTFIVLKEKEPEKTFSEQTLDEIIITEYLTKGISKKLDASFNLKPKQLGVLPGLIDADILESIQELSGVISPNETASGLNIRGGSSDENLLLWDNINVYHNGHLFGMISPFNPNITQNIQFYNKGTNPRFGERLSGVIDISTNNTVTEKTHVGIGLNGISVDGFLETPIIKNKLSILLSYRRSYEGFFETNSFQKMEDKVFQNSSILDEGNSEEDFYFKDYNLKLNYQINKNHRLNFSYIHIDNDLTHQFDNVQNNQSFIDFLDIENKGFSLNWKANWNNHITQNTSVNSSNYTLNYDFTSYQNTLENLNREKHNEVEDYNFLTEFEIRLKNSNMVDLGVQISKKEASYIFKETSENNALEQDYSKVNTCSLFTNYTNRTSKIIFYNLGFRVNYYSILDEVRLEPRIILTKDLTKTVKLQATAEVKNQAIYQINESVLSDSSLENKLWRIADKNNAPILNSKQISLGTIYKNNNWDLDFDFYYKQIKGVSAFTQGLFENIDDEVYNGRKRILGFDLFAKKSFNKINAWASYSLSEIDNKFEGIDNNNYFTARNEIRNALSTSVAYKTDKIQIALGWKWHNGKPFTNFTTSNNTIEFDKINDRKLPNYDRLDLSAFYNFNLAKDTDAKGKIGFSIRNLYNKKNLLSREYIVGENNTLVEFNYYSIGFMPNFLLRFNW